MKQLLLLALLFVSSCASGPDLNKMSHGELTDYVMTESLLSTALSSSSASAINCIQPFQGSLPKDVYANLSGLLRENFKYEDMYGSIRQKLTTSSDKEQMKDIAEELDGKIWQKYLHGIEGAASVGQDKYLKLYQSLDEGTFDLSTKRAQLVAKITDHSYMVNLVNISNTQVLRLLTMNMPSTLTEQQQNVVNWIGNELKILNEAHIKTLFATAYLSTEKFSEPELEDLLKIRSHDVLKQGKFALEEELSERYYAFFMNMKELGKQSQK